MSKNPIFLAWAAGFFDGEGCVLVEMSKSERSKGGKRFRLHATVTQTSLPCLDKYMSEFGGKIVTNEYTTPNGRRWSVQHRWSVRDKEALAFLAAIHPYTVVKYDEITVALNYPMSTTHNKLDAGIFEKRLEIREQLKNIRANRKVPAKVKEYAK
jgi:hypothetical protein